MSTRVDILYNQLLKVKIALNFETLIYVGLKINKSNIFSVKLCGDTQLKVTENLF